MTKELFPGKPHKCGTMAAALDRIGDGGGLHESTGSTMNLSREDHDMSTPNFGGHRAAPFAKGGGRKADHPNDAKGRKKAVAKALLKKGKATPPGKSKGGDYSNVDLARFNRGEPRDNRGRWTEMGGLHHSLIKEGDSLDPDGKVVVTKVHRPVGQDYTEAETRVTGARALRFTPSTTRFEGVDNTIYRMHANEPKASPKTLAEKNEAARNLLTRGPVSKEKAKALAAKNEAARLRLTRGKK